VYVYLLNVLFFDFLFLHISISYAGKVCISYCVFTICMVTYVYVYAINTIVYPRLIYDHMFTICTRGQGSCFFVYVLCAVYTLYFMCYRKGARTWNIYRRYYVQVVCRYILREQKTKVYSYTNPLWMVYQVYTRCVCIHVCQY